MMPAVLTGVRTVRWWPGLTWCSDSIGYVAVEARIYCSGSAECWFSSTGVDRYACSHGLDAVVLHSSHASSIHLGYCNAMLPQLWQCQPAGLGRVWDSAHPSLHVPLPCPTLYPTPSWAHWLDRQCACWRDWTQPWVILSHSGAISGSVNWSGKMMCVTSNHNITAQRYRRANSDLWYRCNESDIVGRDHTIHALCKRRVNQG